MILFRKVYKSANDDITPNPELLDKILANEKKSYNTYRNFYKYGSVAAAFFILIGTFSVYPKIKDNLNMHDNTAVIEIKSENTQTSDESFTPADEIPAKASTALETEKTHQSKLGTDKKISNSQKRQNITPEASEKSPSPTPTEDVILVSPTTDEGLEEENVSVARSIDNMPAYSDDIKALTEDEAILLADEVFRSDFGEEFLNSTEIKTEFSESFKITRFNENLSYTVTVHTDGLIEKEYENLKEN